MTLRTGVSSYSNSDDRTSRLFKKYVNYWYWNLNSKTCFIWIFILVLELHCSLSYKYSPEFNDKLQFDISWRGPVDAEDELLKGKESIIVKTKEKEKYQCILPKVNSQDEDEGNMLGGPSPEELLKNVLLPGAKCSYRLEPYWTYEICHGLHVRQFHEEKDANELKVQEFYLGKTDKKDGKTEQDDHAKEEIKKRKVPKLKIDGRDTPYYNITMGNGTPCDTLGNNNPRQVNVIYICHPTANNEVMNVKETTTCEYEIIVLTSELCKNSVYRVKDDPVYDIRCHSLDGSPSHPNSLLTQIEETAEEHAVRVEREITRFKTRKGERHDFPPVHEEETPFDSGRDLQDQHRTADAPADDQLTKEFLRGEYCLRGGTGWWKYEFCYGKHVSQYHVEPHEKTTINLGFWDTEKHLEWVKTRKKVKSTNYVIHYYQNGDFCDLVGKPRFALVKLKCKKGQPGQQLAIYLLEPAPCEYIIGDDASAGIQSLQTSIEIKLCQNPGDRLYTAGPKEVDYQPIIANQETWLVDGTKFQIS